jgi:hypothetical protein
MDINGLTSRWKPARIGSTVLSYTVFRVKGDKSAKRTFMGNLRAEASMFKLHSVSSERRKNGQERIY